jgi:hypothetical protein
MPRAKDAKVPRGEPPPDDGGSGLRRVVLSAAVQAVIRELLDALIRVVGRSGPL